MKPVTVQEVIDALRENFRPYYKDHMLVTESELAERIRTHGIAPPEGYAIVPIYDCDVCGNDGKNRLTAWMPDKPCFCVEMPHSRFSQRKALLAAAPKQENE